MFFALTPVLLVSRFSAFSRRLLKPSELTTPTMPRAKSEASEKADAKASNNKRGRKPKKQEEHESDASEPSEEEAQPKAKKSKTEKKNGNATKPAKPAKTLMNKASTAYDKIDFECQRKSSAGDEWNFKISSWNVDGIRAWMTKGGLDFIHHEKPDIFCLQETKCSQSKLPPEAVQVPDYLQYWLSSEKEGYAGVGMYTKKKPISVSYGLGPEFDDEGRIITAEFQDFYLISVYVPNSGRGLVTLPKRLEWNKAFLKHAKNLDSKKPVIICGDMNVSHLEIDLTNPKTNKKNAGFTQEERDGMTEFLGDGFVDTFRNLYPEETGQYTFWTYMSNCRAKNVGWRLDYAIVSERLMPSVCDNIIRKDVFGSDHCPITLFLHFKD